MNNEINRFVDQLILSYAFYDPMAAGYEINHKQVAEFDMDKLCGLIMSHNGELAQEANGPDNKAFFDKMLPALIVHLKDSCSKSREKDFVHAWRNGILKYLDKVIMQLFVERLEIYNANYLGAEPCV